MPNVGPLELLVVMVIALIVFGPKKLPELGKGLGEAIRGFKKGFNEVAENLTKSETTTRSESGE